MTQQFHFWEYIWKNTNLNEHMYLFVHCSIIYNSQDLKAAQVPTGRWVDKKAVINLHSGILTIKKKEILLSVTAWLDLLC